MAVTRLAALFLCIVIAVSALPAKEEARSNAIQTEDDLLAAIYNDCLRKDTASCFKYKVYSYLDKYLGVKDTITVTDGVQIIKTGGETEGAPRAITSEDTIESLIFNRIARFLETHTIKVDVKGSEIVNAVSSTARSLGDIADSLTEDDNSVGEEEGRGKKKKGNKMMGPLMAAMALKAALLGKLALGAIALIAGKALLIGKIALVLSAIIGLKKLLGQNQGKHVTYEVVAHPQHSTSHVQSHEVYSGGGGSAHGGGYGGDIGGGGGYSSGGSSGHGGWGRSLEAQQLAYRGQAQAQA